MLEPRIRGTLTSLLGGLLPFQGARLLGCILESQLLEKSMRDALFEQSELTFFLELPFLKQNTMAKRLLRGRSNLTPYPARKV